MRCRSRSRAETPRSKPPASEERERCTLIGLLVVVVIIGVLIAIAIPLYLNYKKGANDKAAQSDLRSAINVLAQRNADNGLGYPSAGSAAGALTGCTQTLKLTTATTIVYYPKSSTGLTAYMSMANSGGSGRIYCYHSAVAGPVTSSAVTGLRSSC